MRTMKALIPVEVIEKVTLLDFYFTIIYSFTIW